MRYTVHFQDHSGRTRLHVSVQASSEADARWAAEQYVHVLSKRQHKRLPYDVTQVYPDEPIVEHRADGSVWMRLFQDDWERIA